MEDLLRFEKCLKTLQEAPFVTVEPRSHLEFLQKLQKLKLEINDQLSHVKAFNCRARKLTATMQQEIPNIVKLCHNSFQSQQELAPNTTPKTPANSRVPSNLRDRCTGKFSAKTSSPKTPEVLTPKRRTPMSTALLKNKFLARCSPTALLLSQKKKSGLKKPFEYLDSTPQMPSRTTRKTRDFSRGLPTESSAKNLSAALRNVSLAEGANFSYQTKENLVNDLCSNTSTYVSETQTNANHIGNSSSRPNEALMDRNRTVNFANQSSMKPPTKNSTDVFFTSKATSKTGGESAAILPKTPVMLEKVSFFTNPNVANIHRRYVAMQDKNAEESTCLLNQKLFESRTGQKTSTTPEMPSSCQKKAKDGTPFRVRSVTPPLPLSSIKKPPRSTTPPLKTPNSNRRPSRTPSPPRAKSKSRACLETRIETFQMTNKAQTQKFDTNLLESEKTPKFPEKSRNVTLPVKNVLMNQPKFSQTLLETPVFSTRPSKIQRNNRINCN